MITFPGVLLSRHLLAFPPRRRNIWIKKYLDAAVKLHLVADLDLFPPVRFTLLPHHWLPLAAKILFDLVKSPFKMVETK